MLGDDSMQISEMNEAIVITGGRAELGIPG